MTPVTMIAEGSNRAFACEVATRAAPETIWALWMDAGSWKRWDRGLKDAELDSSMRLGAEGTVIPLSGPASRFKVTEFEPKRAYAFVTALPLARLTIRRTIVGTAPTRFRHDVSFSGIAAGIWARLFGPSFRRQLPPTMQALADLAAEGEPNGQ